MSFDIRKYYVDGFGNVNYSSPAGAGPGFINVAGARDGLSVDGSQYIVLGQPVADAGNVAKLLEDREIPFNGYSLNLYDLLNTTQQNEIAIFGDAMLQLIEQDNGAAKFMYLQPYNYGVQYPTTHSPAGTTTMDRWLLGLVFGANNDDPGTMPDAVLNFGYNITPQGGRQNTDDAAFRLGFETNYFIGTGGLDLVFEFHMPEVIMFNGFAVRTDSKYVDKRTGRCLWQTYTSDHEYFTTEQPGNPIFMQLVASNGGLQSTINLYGNDSTFNSPDAVIQANATDGAFIKFIMQHGNLFLGTGGSANASAFTLFDTGNFHIARSQSLVPSTWRGVLIGNDGIGTDSPDPALALDVIGTTKAFAPPRMTTAQKNAIPSPPQGSLLYDTDLAKLCVRGAASWETITSV